MPADPLVVVGVAALIATPTESYRASDHGLLIQRRKHSSGLLADGDGTWAVPGGWLEHGEDPEETVVREVAEETGVVVVPTGRRGYVVTHTERTHVTLFIDCDYVSGEPTIREPDKCDWLGWLTWPEIKDGRPLFEALGTWLDTHGKPTARIA